MDRLWLALLHLLLEALACLLFRWLLYGGGPA